MDIANIIIGICALFLAWAFNFKTGLVFKLNSWLKENLFNDKLILYSRRRLAVLLILLGLLALFSGFEGLISDQNIKPNIAQEILEMAQSDFQTQHYKRAIKRSKELIRFEPKNSEAHVVLAMSWWTIGEKKQAEVAARQVMQLDPDYNLKENAILSKILKSSEKELSH